MTRAVLVPLAHSSALKPGGSLILSTGISPGALGAGGWAIGASVESARFEGWPCFQDGGGCWAWAGSSETARAPSSSTVRSVTTVRRMVNLHVRGGIVGRENRVRH